MIHRVSQSPELPGHLALGALLQVTVTELNRVLHQQTQRTANRAAGTDHDHDCDQRREDDYENEET